MDVACHGWIGFNPKGFFAPFELSPVRTVHAIEAIEYPDSA
ncbi:MAG: hypothetical protein ACI9W2_002841 [Gammaproteobacteria bacterium]|jgi:hypothetical protein